VVVLPLVVVVRLQSIRRGGGVEELLVSGTTRVNVDRRKVYVRTDVDDVGDGDDDGDDDNDDDDDNDSRSVCPPVQ